MVRAIIPNPLCALAPLREPALSRKDLAQRRQGAKEADDKPALVLVFVLFVPLWLNRPLMTRAPEKERKNSPQRQHSPTDRY
jgi:hypothetical protein